MKYTIICLFFTHGLIAQSELIRLPKYYTHEGVILSLSKMDESSAFLKGLYDLTREDIIKAENLLSLFDCKKQKFRRKGVHQYLGYTDNNQRYILINVIKMSKKDMNGIFKNWKDELILPFTEFGEEVNLIYKVHLESEMIGYY